MNFKVGDVVHLKSGGIQMTIEQEVPSIIVGVTTWRCVWFHVGQIRSEDLPEAVLTNKSNNKNA